MFGKFVKRYLEKRGMCAVTKEEFKKINEHDNLVETCEKYSREDINDALTYGYLYARHQDMKGIIDKIHKGDDRKSNEAVVIQDRNNIRDEMMTFEDNFRDNINFDKFFNKVENNLMLHDNIENARKSEAPTTIGHIQHLSKIVKDLDEVSALLCKIDNSLVNPKEFKDVESNDIMDRALFLSCDINYEFMRPDTDGGYYKKRDIDKGTVKMSKEEFTTVIAYLRDSYINELALHGIRYNYSTRS